jgi:hypothetical protein
VEPHGFRLTVAPAQWACLLRRAADDPAAETQALQLLSPSIARALKQTEKALWRFMPATVQEAFALFCEGCCFVLRWDPRLKHSEAIVGQVKESFAATTKDWPQTPLGGPALLALAEHTRSTLLAFLKTMAGTISRGIIRVADVPGHRRRDR